MATWRQDRVERWSPPGQGQGQGQGDSEGEGTPGEGQGQGSGKSDEDITKEIEGKLGQRKEVPKDEGTEDGEEEGPAKSKGKPSSKSSRSSAMDDLESRKAEVDAMKPKLNWKSLIAQMVSSSVASMDTSYATPHRRQVTGMAVAAQLGAAALKPGDRSMEEQHNKICLVLDTSGSMHSAIPQVLKECKELLKRAGKSKFPVTVIFFAGKADWYQVNLGDDTYWKINGAGDVAKTPDKTQIKKGYEKVLELGGMGGTNFSNTLKSACDSLAGQGYNILIFSDDGIVSEDDRNWNNLKELYLAHKAHVFFIADTQQTWRNAVMDIGQNPRNWTHL
jgi:hypothetical protein